MRRYYVTTFGCQMNAHDSERIRGTLEELGLGEAGSFDDADVLVFNTCTIREKPDRRLRRAPRERESCQSAQPRDGRGGQELLRQGASAIGCSSAIRSSTSPFGPGTIHHLGDWLGAGGFGVSRSAFGTDEERRFSAHLPGRTSRPFQAWVQISMGCNSVCAYCIVPAVRGREVSRPLDEVVEQDRPACGRRRA